MTDSQEAALGTDPTKRDTDGGGIEDGTEVNGNGTDPLNGDDDIDDPSDDQTPAYEDGWAPNQWSTVYDGVNWAKKPSVTITWEEFRVHDTDNDGVKLSTYSITKFRGLTWRLDRGSATNNLIGGGIGSISLGTHVFNETSIYQKPPFIDVVLLHDGTEWAFGATPQAPDIAYIQWKRPSINLFTVKAEGQFAEGNSLRVDYKESVNSGSQNWHVEFDAPTSGDLDD